MPAFSGNHASSERSAFAGLEDARTNDGQLPFALIRVHARLKILAPNSGDFGNDGNSGNPI
jgi:hypothetical protein